MEKGRDFIQETINTLKNSAEEITIFYEKFKNDEISIEEFEEEYKHNLNNCNFEDEIYTPNNGCPYMFKNKL